MSRDASGLSERQLVDRFCRHGDESAFRALYRMHTPLLYRVARRLLGERDDAAAEVVQDTWVRAAQKLATFRWESSLSTWLAGIVVNRSREELRERCRTLTETLDPANLPAAGSSGAVRVDLESALRALPNGYREVLVLHDIEGYTHEEIGQLLGIDPGTSKSQLSRARHAMRMWLQQSRERGES